MKINTSSYKVMILPIISLSKHERVSTKLCYVRSTNVGRIGDLEKRERGGDCVSTGYAPLNNNNIGQEHLGGSRLSVVTPTGHGRWDIVG